MTAMRCPAARATRRPLRPPAGGPLRALPAGLVLVALALAALALPQPALAQSASAWLDRSPPGNWNQRNGAIPAPPAPVEGDISAIPDPRCLAEAKAPAGAEESAVAAAGWHLFDAPSAGAASGGLRVVSGTTGYDGMCRPMGYQQFVFAGGAFAGTISPTPMYSRTDGEGSVRGPYGPDTLTAIFARYGEADPVCCPSRETVVAYRIDRSAAPPLLVPTSATTGNPGAAPAPPAPGQAPALGNLTPGTVVALRGTPHLWIAEADGALHWVGDTRALSGRPVNWSSRLEVDLAQLRAARLGDPFLSAGLVRRNGPIYLAKWEQGQAQPTLLHIQTIADVEVFGINGSNYGQFVLEEPAWNQRYGFAAATLPTGELEPAAAGV